MDMVEMVIYLSTALCLVSVPVMEFLATRSFRQQQLPSPKRPAPRAQVFVMPQPVIKVEPIPLKKAA